MYTRYSTIASPRNTVAVRKYQNPADTGSGTGRERVMIERVAATAPDDKKRGLKFY